MSDAPVCPKEGTSGAGGGSAADPQLQVLVAVATHWKTARFSAANSRLDRDDRRDPNRGFGGSALYLAGYSIESHDV
jgi:hypothetical protein